MLELIKEPDSSLIKDTRKQQLIDATISCIYKHGLAGTTIAKVTKTASLSTGTVNFYFDTKERLLLGTLRSIRDEFHHALVQGIDKDLQPAAVLQQMINVHFDPEICRPEKIAVWHAFSSASRTRADYHSLCGELDRHLSALFLHQIERLCEQANIAHYNPQALALGLEGMLDSLWQEYLYQSDNFDRDKAIQQCLLYLQSLFPESCSQQAACSKALPYQNHKAESDLLPPWTYSNDEFLQLEINKLFKPNWMLAGHISELAQKRDYLTFDGFGERAIVIKGDDNEIRAFHNVCRHRGARLLEGSGSNCPQALSCPFHGWTYDLSGKLIAVPARDTFENLDLADNGLVPLECEIWMGFVFVRFIPGGQSLKAQMAPVEEMIAPYQIEKMQKLDGTGYRELRPYNWKVIHDIDNEGYHVPVGHPALQQLYGQTYIDSHVEGISMSRGYINEKPGKNWSVQKYQKLLPPFSHLPEDNQRQWLYFGIFPNHVLGLYPECIEFYMTIPQTTHSTWYIGHSYGLPDARREVRAARFLNQRINYITEREDEAFVKSMQDGMRSSAFPKQQLSSKEQGVRRFHKEIQSQIPVAGISKEPEPGTIILTNSKLGEKVIKRP